MSSLKDNLSFLALSLFFVFALFNPIFKKYDYGAGFPLIILMAGLVLLLAVFEFRKKREIHRFEPLFLLLFVAAIVMSFIFSSVKNLGFSEVMAFSGVSVLYLLMAYQRHSWIDKFLNLVAGAAFFAALLGFFLYFTEPEVRMVGPFFNILYHAHVWPNAFALFLLLSWPAFLRNFNWMRAIALGVVISALLLSFSRGALIAFGGQLLLFGIYFSRRVNLKNSLLVLLTLAVAGSSYFGANLVRSANHEIVDVEARISFANQEGLTSKQERIDFWQGALYLADDNPLFGYGPFSFRAAYGPIQETFLGNADHPHNIFLKIAAENGLIALFAFVAFLLSVLIVLARRFKDLKKKEKDQLAVMVVAIAGAFAHNLIDYNFNFAINLLLLFVYLALIRSIASRPKKIVKAKGPLVLALMISIFAFYEGSILLLSETSDDDYLEKSFFPRNHYLNEAQEALEDGEYEVFEKALNEHLALNSLDAQAYYLQGVYCMEVAGDSCIDSFEKALNLNPMNDFNYYVEYLRNLPKEDAGAFVEQSLPLVRLYFGYVENNVHFTAYTPNVEAAARFIDEMIPFLDAEIADEIRQGKQNMLETAEKLRIEKSF